MMMRALWVGICCLSATLAPDLDKTVPVTWSISRSTPTKKPLEGVDLQVKVTASIQAGWHVYAMEGETGGAVHMRISVPEDSAFTLTHHVIPSDATTMQDAETGKSLTVYEDSATFQIPLKLKPGRVPVPRKLELLIRYQACGVNRCLAPQTAVLSLAL